MMNDEYIQGFVDKCASWGIEPAELVKQGQLNQEMSRTFHDQTYEGTEPTKQTDTPAQSSMEAKAPDSGSTERPGPAPRRTSPDPKPKGTGTPSEDRTKTPAPSSEEAGAQDSADRRPGTARPAPAKKNTTDYSKADTSDPTPSPAPTVSSDNRTIFSDTTPMYQREERRQQPGRSAFGIPDDELPLGYPIAEPLYLGEPMFDSSPDLGQLLGALGAGAPMGGPMGGGEGGGMGGGLGGGSLGGGGVGGGVGGGGAGAGGGGGE